MNRYVTILTFKFSKNLPYMVFTEVGMASKLLLYSLNCTNKFASCKTK